MRLGEERPRNSILMNIHHKRWGARQRSYEELLKEKDASIAEDPRKARIHRP